MPEKKIPFQFHVEPFQEDFTGHLSWSNLGNLLLRCASLHAGAHGFGYNDMSKHHRGWVLSRLVVELSAQPRTNDAYTISTWVGRIFRQFTDRFFSITAPDGSAYGYAHSIWALIDYNTRMPIDLTQLPEGGFGHALLEESVPIAPPGRIRCKSTEPVMSRKMAYSDLDINGHVNSIRYIDMVLDLFDADWHRLHPARRIEMAYCLEAFCGDTLLLYKEEKGNNTFNIDIRKDSGETIVRAEVRFD